MKVPFNFNSPNLETAWLLGFIFSDAIITIHQGRKVILLYNINKELLEVVKIHFNIPYKVTRQKNTSNIIYFIRFSDPEFVQSVELYGFAKDKSNLQVPKMNSKCIMSFIKGFLTGKGSFYSETTTVNYGFKVVFRSKLFIDDLAKHIADCCNVRIATPHCRLIKNETSCQIKYSGYECDKIKDFLNTGFVLTENTYSHTMPPLISNLTT